MPTLIYQQTNLFDLKQDYSIYNSFVCNKDCFFKIHLKNKHTRHCIVAKECTSSIEDGIPTHVALAGPRESILNLLRGN